MSFKKKLRTFQLRDDLFRKVLEALPLSTKIINEEEYSKSIYGYADKNRPYYYHTPNEDKLIIKTSSLAAVLGPEFIKTTGINVTWKQVIVVSNTELSETITEDIGGWQAYRDITVMLKKYYTKEEIENILNTHTLENPTIDDKQQHFNPIGMGNKIVRYKNAKYYDINAAHTSALLELFPKAKESILYMYKHRHDDNDKYKKMINYYIGYLCRVNHRPTYNWVVSRTNHILMKAEDIVGLDKFIYINTDGFMTYSDAKLDVSNEIGEFGLEYEGDIYTYTDKNYFIIQYGDTLKGNALCEIRKGMDLRKGKVITYDRVLIGSTSKYTATNVQEGQRDIIDYEEI